MAASADMEARRVCVKDKKIDELNLKVNHAYHSCWTVALYMKDFCICIPRTGMMMGTNWDSTNVPNEKN